MDNRIHNINTQNIYINGAVSSSDKTKQTTQNSAATNTMNYNKALPYPKAIHFQGFFSDLLGNSKFKNSKDKAMYRDIRSSIGNQYQKDLDSIFKTGKLLDKNSSDGSSTLDNLHKILTNTRVQGLDGKKIIEETISTLANPYLINQNFGDLPANEAPFILQQSKMNTITNVLGLDSTSQPNKPNTVQDMNVEASGSCVAATIEFNLAENRPAEFTRFVEGLTSPDISVKTDIKYSDISDSLIDAVVLLSEFGVDTKTKDWENLQVTLKPDRDAILRARVQSTYKDPGERSLVDALIQSTFMQLGSQNTYNSLTDKRYGKFNPHESGLTEFEKNFTETIIDHSGGKTSVKYQQIDDSARLVGYNHDFATVKKHILDTLNIGRNITIGITEVQKPAKIQKDGVEYSINSVKYENGKPVLNCVDSNNKNSSMGIKGLVGSTLNIDGEIIKVSNIVEDQNQSKLIYSSPEGSMLELPTSTFVNIIKDINSNVGKIIGGHEMTIIEPIHDKKGELFFVCNDTDDNYDGAVEIKAKDLIPKIHHAGIPNEVLDLPDEPHVSIQLLREYEQSQAENKA